MLEAWLDTAKIPAYSCEDCRKWLHDMSGNIVTLGGEPVARDRPPDCTRCAKYELGIEDLSAENEQMLEQYHEVCICGPTPAQRADAHFREFCGLIKRTEDECRRLVAGRK